MRTEDRAREGAWSVRRRITIGALVLVLLVVLAGVLAYATRSSRDQPPTRPDTSATRLPEAPPSPSPNRSRWTVEVPVPPRTHDPVAFGVAFAGVLWAYDTRVLSQTEYLAGLGRWLTTEERYADPGSVRAQVPTPQVWERMADNGQYATATVAEGHIPNAFAAAMDRDPDAISEAYVYAVTVTGKQAIAWRDGGRGAQPQALTLAVQCRPKRPCSLAGIAPNVAP